MNKTVLSLSAALLLLALGAPAQAQKPLPIPALRASDAQQASAQTIVIRRSGSFFLKRDLLAGEGIAIDIRADDVTLDLRGHTILGLGDKIGVGVRVNQASNVTVFNGKIQDFGIGVQVEEATNVTITGLQIDGQDLGGAPPDIEIGVLILGSRGVEVSHNVISDTFLGVFVRGEASGANRISDNLLAGGENGELAICYNPAPGADGGGPSGDLVTGNHASRFRRALSLSTDSAGNVVRGNTFAYFELGIVEASPGANVIDANDVVQIAR